MSTKQFKRFRKALRGMQGVTVWVHDIDAMAAADGLSRQHLQDEVTVRILDSGIRAFGIANVPEPPGNPWLNVFFNCVKKNEAYFYSVVVQLDEIVRPERNRSVKSVASTWAAHKIGEVSVDGMPEKLELEMDELVDLFIYDYTQANSL